MRRSLAKRWFLLTLLTGLTLAAVRPDLLRPFAVRLNPRVVVSLALLLMAAGLDGRRLWESLVRPFPALWALLISYGPLPALAWGLGHLLPDDLRVGLLLAASVPCTLASAVLWTRMAGGNEV